MVWGLFATKPEMADTLEGLDLNMRAPLFHPTKVWQPFATKLETAETM
jgi:hypothetical protein